MKYVFDVVAMWIHGHVISVLDLILSNIICMGKEATDSQMQPNCTYHCGGYEGLQCS